MKAGEAEFAPVIKRLEGLASRLDRIERRLDDLRRDIEQRPHETHLTVRSR